MSRTSWSCSSICVLVIVKNTRLDSPDGRCTNLSNLVCHRNVQTVRIVALVVTPYPYWNTLSSSIWSGWQGSNLRITLCLSVPGRVLYHLSYIQIFLVESFGIEPNSHGLQPCAITRLAHFPLLVVGEGFEPPSGPNLGLQGISLPFYH